MKPILKDTFKILNRKETQKLWELTLADVFISVLDIVFLFVLLYVINSYTIRCAGISKVFFTSPFNEHPVLLIILFLLPLRLRISWDFISKAQFNYVYGAPPDLQFIEYLNGPYTDYILCGFFCHERRISQQPIEFCHYVLNGFHQIFSRPS